MLLFFTIHGRIKRLTFWEGLVAWLFFNSLVLMTIFAVIATPMYGPATLYDFLSKNLGDTEHVFFHIITSGMLYVQWVFALWMLAAICVKRWHDLNYPGWLAVINLVPVMIPVAGVMAFLGNIDRLLVYKLIADPHAGLFPIISKSLVEVREFALGSNLLQSLIIAVLVIGSFLYLGVFKGTRGANAYGKGAV